MIFKKTVLSIIFIFLLTFPLVLLSDTIFQSSFASPPSWINEPPKGNYFKYYTGMGSSKISLSEAKEQAINSLIIEIIMEGEISVKGEIHTLQKQSNEKYYSEITKEIYNTGKSTNITGLQKEEEYWTTIKNNKDIIYQYWILMKIPKNNHIINTYVEEQGYGYKPVLKSALVPGWGQFHKGEKTKGIAFLTSEIVLLSTSVISNYYSRYYSSKAQNEHDYERRVFYNEWASRSYSIGVISGIASGAFYIFNIADAIVSKGAKKYAHSRLRQINLATNLCHERIKINLTLNF